MTQESKVYESDEMVVLRESLRYAEAKAARTPDRVLVYSERTTVTALKCLIQFLRIPENCIRALINRKHSAEVRYLRRGLQIKENTIKHLSAMVEELKAAK